MLLCPDLMGRFVVGVMLGLRILLGQSDERQHGLLHR